MSIREQNFAEVSVEEGDSIKPSMDKLRTPSEVVAALPSSSLDEQSCVEYCSGFIRLTGGCEDEDDTVREVLTVSDELEVGRDLVSNNKPVVTEDGCKTSRLSYIVNDFSPGNNVNEGDGIECCSGFIRLTGGSEGNENYGDSERVVEAVGDDLEEVKLLLDVAGQKKAVKVTNNKDGSRRGDYGDGADSMEDDDLDDDLQNRASTSSDYTLIMFDTDDDITAVRKSGKRRQRWTSKGKQIRSRSQSRSRSKSNVRSQSRSLSKNDDRRQRRSSSKMSGRSQNRLHSKSGSGPCPARVVVTDRSDNTVEHHRSGSRRVTFVSSTDTTPNRPKSTKNQDTSPIINQKRNHRPKK